MPELNREEFGDVKFYHGTTKDLDRLLPADVHGKGYNFDISNTESAYVTTSEEDAWRWSGRGTEDRNRVYEVEPYGRVRPDRNLPGPQFEVEGAEIKRELPGPVDSQLALFPDSQGRAYTRFEDIAYDQALAASERDAAQRLDGGFQGVPQDTTLFDGDPELRTASRRGRLPHNASSKSYTDDRILSRSLMNQQQDYKESRWARSEAQESQGMKLRRAMERATSVDRAPDLDETFRRL